MEKKPILIGLGSKAQIGKDFACEGLKMYFDIQRVAFADALKNDLAMLFDINKLDFHGLCQDIGDKTIIRPLMTAYGDCMRHFYPNVWIDRAMKQIQNDAEIVMITDVRFPNEVEAIKNMGGWYIDIDADVEPANVTEAKNAPYMRMLADFVVRNNFDEKYIHDMLDTVKVIMTNPIPMPGAMICSPVVTMENLEELIKANEDPKD